MSLHTDDVPTQALVAKDVVRRLETARLIINQRGYLSVPLSPILAGQTEMWAPEPLEEHPPRMPWLRAVILNWL